MNMHPHADPDNPLAIWRPRPTKAQQEQHDWRRQKDAVSIAMASDKLALLTFDQTCTAILGHMKLRDDVDPERLTFLSNELGQIAHFAARPKR